VPRVPATVPPDPRARFAALAAQPEPDLAEAALWLAAEEYPSLDVPAYLARIGELAAEARPALAGAMTGAARVARLNRFLFVECGFRGNREEYYDPRNSYLNEVLDRRTGIPISLSAVYLAVGRRLGLEVHGISFPGHFLVKCVCADGELVIDPFERVVLDLESCQRRLDAALPAHVPLRPELHLRAASTREILLRMLANLKRIYAERRDLERTLACCDRILLLDPDAPGEQRDRARVAAALRAAGRTLH
jgi:regulator of sirC expression with transglutaminase-like and TPR domain